MSFNSCTRFTTTGLCISSAFLFVRSYYFNQSVIFSSVAWFALNGLHHFAEYFFLIFTAIFCGSVAPLVVKIAAFFPFRFTLSRKLNTAFGNVPQNMKEDFTSVLLCNLHLANIVFPYGTTGGSLDVIGRLPLWKRG